PVQRSAALPVSICQAPTGGLNRSWRADSPHQRVARARNYAMCERGRSARHALRLNRAGSIHKGEAADAANPRMRGHKISHPMANAIQRGRCQRVKSELSSKTVVTNFER